MKAFRRLRSVAAPLARANIDTDQILPGQFLKTLSRDGLGKHLFHSLRQEPGFVLNNPPWNQAKILVTLDNFGCGSSREHAPWALLDFGIRCIVAPSFADIFASNCFKNGILTVTLPRSTVATLLELAAEPSTATLEVDLESQTVTAQDRREWSFDIEPQRKQDLLLGIDEIARSLSFADRIREFEQTRRQTQPWLQPDS